MRAVVGAGVFFPICERDGRDNAIRGVKNNNRQQRHNRAVINPAAGKGKQPFERTCECHSSVIQASGDHEAAGKNNSRGESYRKVDYPLYRTGGPQHHDS